LPESLLNILKVAFLALLWLFFLRVLRAVWAEIKAPVSVVSAPIPAPMPAATAPAPAPAPAPVPTRTSAGDGVAGRLLIVDAPEQQGATFPLADELTVGRGGGCAIALRDRMVSQLHARIFKRDGQFFVEDLGSTNGTLLNGKKVAGPAAIRRGDRLQVGKTVLELTK